MKQEYIEAITALMNECCDMQVLDIIYKLLKKRNAKAGEANA